MVENYVENVESILRPIPVNSKNLITKPFWAKNIVISNHLKIVIVI